METTVVDREFGSAMGALFHQIITDMKVRMSYGVVDIF